MTYVIVLLLALILVAIISSDKAAAAGVTSVVKIACWAVLAATLWLVWVGYWIALESAYPATSSEWIQLLGLAFFAITPLLLGWLNRRKILESYRRDKRAAVKYGAKLSLWLIVGMAGGLAVRHLQSTVPQGGWIALSIPLIFLGAVLVFRTFNRPREWRTIWFGSSVLDARWRAIEIERDGLEEANRQAIDSFATREISEEHRENLWREQNARLAPERNRLNELEDQIYGEMKTYKESAVLSWFWTLALFAGLGLGKELWVLGYDYAMGLSFVRGREWMAAGASALALMTLAGLLLQVWEGLVNLRRHRKF